MSEAETTPASTLNLGKRQREMLEAMGIKVWWPETPVAFAATEPPVQEPEPAPVPVKDPPAPSKSDPVEEPRAPPAAVPARAPVAAGRPFAGTVSQGASGVLVDAPRRLYGETGTAQGGWLVVADMAPDSLGRHGSPFEGDEGRLLDNMLRALQLHAGDVPVHLVRVHRGQAMAGEGLPRPFEEAFAAQVEPIAPRMVLALGPLAAQNLMQRAGPIGKLRGEAVALAAWPGAHVVATYHPAYLLRTGADKARAWSDLCLAAAVFERGAA